MILSVNKKALFIYTAISCITTAGSYAQKPVFQGQGPIQSVRTASKPIQKQWKGIFSFDNGNLSFSNDFDGGRLNGITQTNDSTVVILITPENTPINPSPWYAFKVWSGEPMDLYINLTYQEPAKHRYYPKVSTDGANWSPLDSAQYFVQDKGHEAFGPGSLPLTATMKVSTSPDTLWVAGQELQTSKHVYGWAEKIASNSFASLSEIGRSKEGRSLKVLTIGKKTTGNMVMVISRQHPPEVTGYLAMKAFVETLCSDSKLARKFRKKYTTLVVPLMNPDGVDNGHWRHNAGGVDLNRDWADFNQPETTIVGQFMDRMVADTGRKFYFGIDFHSTWDDIYYTIDPGLKSNMPGLIPQWLDQVKAALPDYEPNIRPSNKMEPTTVSRNYFFMKYGAEALVYEVGDNTPREFLRQKGEMGANALMELMLKRK